MTGPSRVTFTRHAETRAAERRVSLEAAADLVLDEHPRRRRSPGPADWTIGRQGMGVAYDWPGSGDATLAVVVTVWRE